MELIINTVIQPIFSLKDSYFYKLKNDFIEIENKDLIDFIIKIFTKNNVINKKDLIKKLKNEFKITENEAMYIIQSLMENSFLTEKIKKDRYHTNKLFFSLFDNINKNNLQNKIKNLTVAILGLGGSTLILQQLAQLGVKKIIGLDFDTLEESNLNRQVIFKEKDIGKQKVTALMENLKEINSNVKYDLRNIYVNNENDVLEIINESDIIILALDEPIIDSSILIHNICKKNKKRLISGGVWGDFISYMYFDYEKNPNLPCYECIMNQEIKNNIISKEYIKNIRGKSFKEFNTTTIFVGSILSGIITTEIVKIFTGYHEYIESGKILTLNTSSWDFKIEDFNKEILCEKCKKGNNNE